MAFDINAEQRRASNPLNSVWVAASAGSGKTKVLTDRVLNLLLRYGKPEKLLCLTFTKAAAAEMANRINDTLKLWTVLSDEELSAYIENLNGKKPNAETMNLARQLFARVLETPGGMKIMTIHSFCQSVLKRFPLEAGITPHFEVIDDNGAKKLIEDAIRLTLTDTKFDTQLTRLSDYLDEKKLVELFGVLLSERDKMGALSEHYTDEKQFKDALKKKFNLSKYHVENDIILEHFSLQEFETYKKTYLKKDGTVFKKYETDPTALLVHECVEKYTLFKNIENTVALFTLGFAVLSNYTRLKTVGALLDYDDLIHHTKNLLQRSTMSAWVLYKLDGGIDHILVDEAQDTNPDQWRIIQLLTEEFFAGFGKDVPNPIIRTVFAVGDKKQSIFSFQGAEPAEFERMRYYFFDKVTDAQRLFETVPLNLSFRSTRPVLELVNYVLNNPVARAGVAVPSEDVEHYAFREQDAGLVEIWPVEEPAETDEPEPWKQPIERIETPAAVTRLAEKVASKIKKLLDTGEILESQGRPIEPGDFLILVQRREKFIIELVRLLKIYNIPVAGIDRLKLMEHIAIQDLIAMARFVLLPEDDLNLACLIKSPLVGLSEEDLFQAAYNRGSDSLWKRIQSLYPTIAEQLRAILNLADTMPVFEFFASLLGPLQGRKRFVARLGEEANEALDEFLNLTLSFEQGQTPSLQSFLHWLSDREIEIKRDMEQGMNAVRIMTVHASKGLQGNIVFLPDTRRVPGRRETLFWTEENLPLWRATAALNTPAIQQISDIDYAAKMDEYRRLLYVALTRAKDRLYICGWDTSKKSKDNNGNWYDLIVQSLGTIQPDTDGIIRIRSPQKRLVVSGNATATETEEQTVLPPYLNKIAPVEPSPPHPLMPSKPVLKEVQTESPLTLDQELALRRGTFLHKLLQYLPDIEPTKRREAAAKLKPQDITIPEQLFDIFDVPVFKEVFGSTSLAEVPVVGVLDGRVISGQVDRLVIGEREVLIIDFKTNRIVPPTLEKVPAVYINQMETYKALLKKIFPDKMVKAYLLWTENLTWIEV